MPPRCTVLSAPSARVAQLALQSLHAELVLFPKPGLVSLIDSGSHQDMDARTFMRSLFALRHYFRDIAEAGAEGATFSVLRELGIAAERRMLQATGGVNTHRGAIFSLGLLCAGVGHVVARGGVLRIATLRTALGECWGQDLAWHAHADESTTRAERWQVPGGTLVAPAWAASHGQQVRARYHLPGAREQAAQGLPLVFDLALPRLQTNLHHGHPWQAAAIDTLFALMAQASDSNVLYRAGRAGMQMVQARAQQFLAAGGCAAPDWQQRALDCHHVFVAERISPGGAADLLAATCFVHFALQSWPAPAWD